MGAESMERVNAILDGIADKLTDDEYGELQEALDLLIESWNMPLLDRVNKDIKKTADSLTTGEARYLVDFYYQIQKYRIKANNQVRILTKLDEEESHDTISYFAANFAKMEDQIKATLAGYIKTKPISKWLLSICGIGPVITAGLIAHIDINKCETAGALWRFAGLDPTVEWKAHQKRPWNAKLKTLCWKAGESFVKTSNREKDIYGHMYQERKAYELEKNEKGEYKGEAEKKLSRCKIGKDTEAYKWYSVGKLPPAHINARAKRYAVKIFLSHLFDTWYRLERKAEPPKPFAIAILGHAHMIEPPEMVA